MRINTIFGSILLILASLTIFTACQNANKTAATARGNGGGATPTEAYKNLYNAVKSKNTDNIKANMSKQTVDFAMGIAAMQKKTPEEMFKNGMIQSTRAETLPPLRNERVKDNMGAVEAQDTDGSWQDIPFVFEDGSWKLGVGDLFKGTYTKPAPSQAETEANNNVPQMLPGMPNASANVNANPNSAANKKQPESDKPAKK